MSSESQLAISSSSWGLQSTASRSLVHCYCSEPAENMLDSAEVNTVSFPLPKKFIGQQKVDKDPVVQKLHLNTRLVLSVFPY